MMRGCEEIREYIAPFQDGELDKAEYAEVQAHLRECVLCRREAEAQALARKRLRALKRRSADVSLPPAVWSNARDAWNRRDATRRRHVRFRLALVGACMLLLTFGAVWARYFTPTDFPVVQAMKDFRSVRNHAHAPQLKTADADQAARWLAQRLHISALPPLNLSLSGAQLVGVDAIDLPPKGMGRLMYRLPDRRLMAIYVVPSGTRFPSLRHSQVETRDFAVETGSRDIGLYGWQHGNIGYGLVLSQPIALSKSFALDAQRATEQP